MSETKLIPLHVLVMSKNVHPDQIHGLTDYLNTSPAIRSIGFAYSYDEFWTALYNNEVNTVFITPPAQEPTKLILEVRSKFPQIVIVLFSHRESLKLFTTDFPEFSHYFQLDSLDVVYRDGRDFNKIISRCEDWHRKLFEYDVALSFSGSDRTYAEGLAKALKELDIRVFYDDFEQTKLFGSNLYTTLYDIYYRRSKYCLMLISKEYVERLWTIHERSSAQERVLKERGASYILPVRIDETIVPGLPSSIGYLSIRLGVEKIASIILEKLRVMEPDTPKVYFTKRWY